MAQKASSRLGQCYALSLQYVLRPDVNHAVLVHGRIHNRLGGGAYRSVDHAWVEEGEEVFHPVLDVRLPKQVYEGLFDAEVYCRYTKEEARSRLVETGHAGPWDVPEEKLNLPYEQMVRKLAANLGFRVRRTGDRITVSVPDACREFLFWEDVYEFLKGEAGRRS